jgi:hypothetical protein
LGGTVFEHGAALFLWEESMFFDELAKARKISDDIEALHVAGVLGSTDAQELKTALRLDLLRLRKETSDLTKVKQVSHGR